MGASYQGKVSWLRDLKDVCQLASWGLVTAVRLPPTLECQGQGKNSAQYRKVSRTLRTKMNRRE